MSTDYSYDWCQSVAGSAIATWSFVANRTITTQVVPDGCRDYIVVAARDQAPAWFVSEVSQYTYQVESNAGDQLAGVRLRAGTQFDERAVGDWLQSSEPEELLVGDRVDEFCEISESLASALDCLASDVPSIDFAARQLGISTRTLQRLVSTGTGRAPYFWYSLARARRTARALPQFDRLADIAGAFQFSDQAHMTREIRRWFGASPNQVRSNPALLAQLAEPGYG